MSDVDKTIQNLVKVVAVLERTQENTNKNVDKLVSNMDKLIPIHEILNSIEKRLASIEDENKAGIRPSLLKGILATSCFILIGFETWVTVTIFGLDKELSNHKTLSMEVQKQQQEDIQDNKNQITYIKGRIK